MSEGWEDLFPMASVRKLVREISDHNPLLLSDGEEGREAPKPREFVSTYLGLKIKNSFLL